MSTSERIVAHLARSSFFPPTAREIADYLGLSRSTVTAALRQLEVAGRVRKLGVASDNSRTWALTDNN